MVKQLDYEKQAKAFMALADPTRLKIVELLAGCEEMSGTDIAEHLGITLALFCHHSKILTDTDIIKKRREGLIRYHSLNRAFLATCLEGVAQLT
ncbi:metalloregulator ArsR/SmtB family transcription factor [Gloeocapsa sp. BRSZ]